MKKSKVFKRLISLIMTIAMLMSMLVFAPAAAAAQTAVQAETEPTSAAEAAAMALYRLGIVRGAWHDSDGNPVFNLDDGATRIHGVIMLLILMGVHDIAEELRTYCPFDDVSGDYNRAIVGYAHSVGWVSGVSPTRFEPNRPLTATEFLTLILHALGYKDGVDFTWSSAWTMTDRLGITDGRFSAQNNSLLRRDMFLTALFALDVAPKDSNVTLLRSLWNDGVFERLAEAELIRDEVVLKAIEDDNFSVLNGILQDALEVVKNWTDPDPEEETPEPPPTSTPSSGGGGGGGGGGGSNGGGPSGPPALTSLHEAIREVSNTDAIVTIGVDAAWGGNVQSFDWLPDAAYEARQRVSEQPFQGYFWHNFPGTGARSASATTLELAVEELADRTFQYYVPKHAPQRTYINVIGVPDGVDAREFLHEEGWFAQADKYGEILVILLPGPDGWGNHDDQLYITAVVGMGNRLDANGQVINPVFDSGTSGNTAASGGIFGGRSPLVFLAEEDSSGNPVVIRFRLGSVYNPVYFVGYGEAAAPMEAHTSYNPQNVIGQAFIGGESVGDTILSANAERIHAGFNNGRFIDGYHNNVFIKQLNSIIDSGSPNVGGQPIAPGGTATAANFITNADIPVPTLLAGPGYEGATNASLVHWTGVNRAALVSEGLYREVMDSGLWATYWANQKISEWNPGATHGISVVQTTSATNLSAEQIRDFLAERSRMNNFTAYSDNINYRLDYQDLNVTVRAAYASRSTALSSRAYTLRNGTSGTTELWAHQQRAITVPDAGTGGGGTFHLAVFAYQDNDHASLTDGKLDGRDVYIYVPDSANGKGEVPMVFGMPGTQNGSIQYFNATQWWKVANDEGFVVVILGQDYASRGLNVSPAGISDSTDASANYWFALKSLLEGGNLDIGVPIDWGRVYGSGYSLGSSALISVTLTGTRLDREFAAIFPHSPISAIPAPTTEFIVPIYYTIGSPESGVPNEPWANTLAEDGLTGDSIVAASSTSLNSYNTVMNATRTNGIDFSFVNTGTVQQRRDSYMTNIATVGEFKQDGRFVNSHFENHQGIELFRFTRVLGREHNFIPEEMQHAWEFMRHFRVDTANGDRYYCENAFASNCAVPGCEGEGILVTKNITSDDITGATITSANRVVINGDVSTWGSGGLDVDSPLFDATITASTTGLNPSDVVAGDTVTYTITLEAKTALKFIGGSYTSIPADTFIDGVPEEATLTVTGTPGATLVLTYSETLGTVIPTATITGINSIASITSVPDIAVGVTDAQAEALAIDTNDFFDLELVATGGTAGGYVASETVTYTITLTAKGVYHFTGGTYVIPANLFITGADENRNLTVSGTPGTTLVLTYIQTVSSG